VSEFEQPPPPQPSPQLAEETAWLDDLDEGAPFEPEKMNGHVRVDDRPEVKLGIDIHRIIDEASREIAKDPLVYQRAHTIVTVVGAPKPETVKRAPMAHGTPTIRTMNAASLMPRLTRYVKFMKLQAPDQKAIKRAAAMGEEPEWALREALAPPMIVSSLLACADWPGIRPLVGVTETPFLRDDGTVCQKRGYDEATGYLYCPSEEFPVVPDEPSQQECRYALEAIQHVFCDFKYEHPSHASVPIAGFLTSLARPCIRGPTPLFAYDATTRGSGKTLQADIVALMSTGRGAARANWTPDEEEMTKTFLSYALMGAQTILLDNINHALGGGVLDMVLTAREDIQLRVLGKNESPRLPWQTVLSASGNNLAFHEDTMRRTLSARLDVGVENPEDRTDFKHPDLFAWVKEHRRMLVCNGLTMLRGITCRGLKPADLGTKRWGTYESWSDLIPPAIVHAGGADPMGARPTRESGASDDLLAHGNLLRELARFLNASGLVDGVTIVDLLRRLYPPPGRGDAPDGWDELRGAIDVWAPTRFGQTPDGRVLGKRFRAAKGRILDGMKLISPGETHRVARWRAVPASWRTIQDGQE
jgi:hypothetical protein